MNHGKRQRCSLYFSLCEKLKNQATSKVTSAHWRASIKWYIKPPGMLSWWHLSKQKFIDRLSTVIPEKRAGAPWMKSGQDPWALKTWKVGRWKMKYTRKCMKIFPPKAKAAGKRAWKHIETQFHKRKEWRKKSRLENKDIKLPWTRTPFYGLRCSLKTT